MQFKEIKEIILPYITQPIIDFKIEKQIFSEKNGRKLFNEKIRSNVDKRHGIYVWVNTATNEIIYIGMAGKIKADGTLSEHTVQSRLLASRGKNKTTKKDIQTNDYIHDLMIDYNIETLNFFIMYSKSEVPPAFIEAMSLYEFYKKNQRLPKLNKSF